MKRQIWSERRQDGGGATGREPVRPRWGFREPVRIKGVQGLGIQEVSSLVPPLSLSGDKWTQAPLLGSLLVFVFTM